jgi:hypothetical protein
MSPSRDYCRCSSLRNPFEIPLSGTLVKHRYREKLIGEKFFRHWWALEHGDDIFFCVASINDCCDSRQGALWMLVGIREGPLPPGREGDDVDSGG